MTGCHGVLQLLQRAAQLGALPADLVEPVLAKSLRQDARSRSPQITEQSRSLLTLMKQTAGALWPQLLHEASVSRLTAALLQEPDQLDAAHMVEMRTAASLVTSPLPPFTTCQALGVRSCSG